MYSNGTQIYVTQNEGYDGVGICAALSMAYCADFLAGKRALATRRLGKNLEVLKSYFAESLAAQQARSEQAARERKKGINVPAEGDAFTYQDEHLASIFRLRVSSSQTYLARALFGFAPPVNTVWYVSHDQKLVGEGGHAIAISTGASATDTCVFDPNHGLYRYSRREDYTKDLESTFALYINRTWGRVTFTTY